ncbi:MAG TPA: hypothetical protein VK485_03420 [Sphingomicrobium sp.]|nr:hypothetical protein [Sphingomicrobium sp.]
MSLTPPMRRYTIRLIFCLVAYGLALVLANMAYPAVRHITPLAWGLAILPALPIVGVFVVIGRLIVETDDEYQRMLFVKQTLIATGLTLSIATVWQWLVNFDLASFPEGYGIAVLWFAMLGVAAIVARWRA